MPPSSDTTPSSETSKDAVFALVIGINDYIKKDQLPPLLGAVNDAKAFREYLLKKLYVQDSNILSLENERATRANIMAAFKSHFLENQSIPDHGETTMIFFFAGHGSRVKAPPNIKVKDNMVEAICPVDERTTNDAGEEYVHTIPDYVLGRLLWEISEKKGRNITVIMDACHSGGMGRDVGHPRAATSDSRPIPQDLDSHLWNGRKSAMPFRMWSASAESHVLLAACGDTETARECQYRKGHYSGRFSTTLLSLLDFAPLEITYEQLINRMPKWSGQTPHCGGNGINRLLFNGNYPKTGLRPISLAPANPGDKSSKLFRVDNMGTIEGVVTGTEFSVDDVKDKFLCTLVAQSVQTTHCILSSDKPATAIPPWSRVVVSDWKNSALILRVHIDADFPYKDSLFPLTRRVLNPPKFVQAPTLEDAHFAVRIERGRGQDPERVVVESRTPTMLKIQHEARFPLPADRTKLLDALDGVAHFNYFLERANDVDTLQGFSLEVYRLKGSAYQRGPDESIGNMVKDGEVHFKSVADAKYGFIIRNTEQEALYPHLFYFDPETFTIQQWYVPETRFGRPPLQDNQPVTIGMGREHAFEFMLEPGQKSSSGFVKLFVTREFVDLGWINQRIPPFDSKFVGNGRSRAQEEPFDKMATWDALTVTLTMTE
ncbi:caspase domain-containing protein [Mycena galopus ATCC 62051]|nr:caspase domain-containing protein [Mycena galopus ATCC 62051]